MDLRLINEFNESAQYRSKSAIKQTNAREVCDLAFMDMIALWILYNEFEFAPVARNYAEKTATFNRFDNYRQMGTDLYLSLHIITQKRVDLLGDGAADSTLLDRVELDVRQIVRYLRQIGRNNMSKPIARQTLQRLEQALHIQNSNYRSIRRLAQNWPELTTAQKRTVLTRMTFFYRAHAQRSEIFKLIKKLAGQKNLIDADANNPEKPSLGQTAAAAAAAGAGGFAAGWNLGKGLA